MVTLCVESFAKWWLWLRWRKSIFIFHLEWKAKMTADGAVAQRVERWTCNQQVMGSNPTRGKMCVTTLGKLFTPMCLCHQAV